MAQPSQFELSTEQYIVADHYIASSVADVQFFTAPVKCEVVSIREIHAVAGSDGSAVSGTIRRCQGTEAATAGDDLLGSTKIDFKGTALTEQKFDAADSGELTSTTANLTLEAGDRLSLDVTGTTTALAGVIVTVLLKRI
jgi:hypothetical protein